MNNGPEKNLPYYENVPSTPWPLEMLFRNLGFNSIDELPKGKLILDIGAGWAALEEYFRKNKEFNTRVISLDPKYKHSEDDLKKRHNQEIFKEEHDLYTETIYDLIKEQKKLKNSGQPPFNLISALAQGLPFKDNVFDLVISHFSFPWHTGGKQEKNKIGLVEWKQDKSLVKQGLEEVLRVLKPGGETRFYPATSEQKDLIEAILKDKPDCFIREQVSRYDPQFGTKEYLLIIEKRKTSSKL